MQINYYGCSQINGEHVYHAQSLFIINLKT